MTRGRTLFSLLVIAAFPAGAAVAQLPDSLPEGVTPQVIEQGRQLFGGAALCAVCHAPDATGAVGPSLVDDEWLHSDGSYRAIVRQIQEGVPAEKARSRVAMPPRGGSNLTDAQIRAVAAYVWSLRRTGS